MKKRIQRSSLVSTILLCACLLFQSAPSNAIAAQVSAASTKKPAVITVTVNKKKVTITAQQLSAMNPKKIRIFDPFSKKSVVFTVVTLEVLFKKVGIKSSGSVQFHALDEYVYSNKVATLIAGKGLLAYEAFSKSIPVSDGGPFRIVYPKNSTLEEILDSWVFSIDQILVK